MVFLHFKCSIMFDYMNMLHFNYFYPPLDDVFF